MEEEMANGLRGNINQYQFQPTQDEDEMELEKELLELEPPHREVVDLDSELELEQKPKASSLLELCPAAKLKSEVKLDTEPKLEVPDLEFCSEDAGPQGYRIQSLHPYTEGLTQRDVGQWHMRSNSSYLGSAEDDQVSTNHRSIRVQTSKHLFWADKLIQASEHSLQKAISTQPQPVKKSTDETTSHLDQQSVPKGTMCSKEQLQDPSAQPALPATGSQPSSSPATIGLADLINFASSLAMASSSKMDLPNLEHMVKAPPQKATEPPTEPTMDEPEQEKLTNELLEKPPEKPLEAGELQKALKQKDKSFPHPYLDVSKQGFKSANIEGEVKFLQPPNMSPQLQEAVKELPQKPQRLLTRDPGEEQTGRMQKGRLQQRAALLTQTEPAAATAPGAEQASQRAKEVKGAKAFSNLFHLRQLCRQDPTTPDTPAAGRVPVCAVHLSELPLSLPPAFQDVFKLFSSSLTGTVDLRSMKAALGNAGVRLTPQEMYEALQQADLDGDGTVSFKDFLGVLTDSHRLAQSLGQVRNSRVCDPQGRETLFLEMMFKLMSLGFVPHKSVQEVMRYYSKKQRSLRLNSSWKGRSRGHCSTRSSHAGLTFFCQAARLSGLSNAELARSLHRLHKADVRSPYSQIPNLNGRTQPECQNRTPRLDIGLPKSYQPSGSKLRPNRGRFSQGFVGQPLGSMHPSKRAPSPPTLVQKQPFSPSPTCLQRPAMKLYK
ncbi:Spermatogenesis-associated protein 32 [Camelus dromedarius]|uniref:Spermatogenesis-associated protein 32 n=1 Tax=Camelus dromedarius TaxID=9838 RepID=A0A5N4D263_CAMDR|nr:Spermatogenesis-associated protein 32 [Camelus dromedarius]